ncbi:hypothetical protein CWI39_0850p0010 [Hamiltosporidium magnivora]|uniref:Uncharacterized protein n=1 Tax=Hamiltosporidium magnivora TaxID=148818 RepID=A0A4Q9LAU5_9MICR|nr:hypothetical protein CWI39_0850p0010 [Hamiltosporidium magnivora]
MKFLRKFYCLVLLYLVQFVFDSSLFNDPHIDYLYGEISKKIKLIFEKVLPKYITEYTNNELYTINLFGLDLSLNRFYIPDYISSQMYSESRIFFTEFICSKEGVLIENRNKLLFEILKSYRNEQKKINLRAYNQINGRDLEFEFISKMNTFEIVNSKSSISDLRNEILEKLKKYESHVSEHIKNKIFKIYIITPFLLKLMDINVLEYTIKELLQIHVIEKDTVILFSRQINDVQMSINKNISYNHFYQLLRKVDSSGNFSVNIEKRILFNKNTCEVYQDNVSDKNDIQNGIIDDLKSKNISTISNLDSKDPMSLIQPVSKPNSDAQILPFLDQSLSFLDLSSSEERIIYREFSLFRINYIFRIFNTEIFRIKLYFQMEQNGRFRYFTLDSIFPRTKQFNQVSTIQYELATQNLQFKYYDGINHRRDSIAIFFYALNHRFEDEIESLIRLSYE